MPGLVGNVRLTPARWRRVTAGRAPTREGHRYPGLARAPGTRMVRRIHTSP